MSKLPPLPEPNTASLAWSGRSVSYITGYEAGYEAASDQLRERDRQIVELCVQIAENTHPSEPQTIAGCIRLLLEDE